MNKLKYLALAVFVGISFTVTVPKVNAQVSVGVNIGVAPACPYGYYDYAPYSCSPYGYYGPEWFSGGVFIGAGSWYGGSPNFHGHVNNRYDPQRGYKGPMPQVGERAAPSNRLDHVSHFKGNEMRDGRGHVSGGRR